MRERGRTVVSCFTTSCLTDDAIYTCNVAIEQMSNLALKIGFLESCVR